MRLALKVSKRTLWPLRLDTLTLALLLIAAGLVRQEPLEVLQKAVIICLECIGIG